MLVRNNQWVSKCCCSPQARTTLQTHNTVHSATGTNTCHHVTTNTAHVMLLLVQTLSAHAGEHNLHKLLGFKHAPLYEWIPATKTSSIFSELLDNADDEDPSIGQQVLQTATEESEVVSASDKACLCILTQAAGVAQSV